MPDEERTIEEEIDDLLGEELPAEEPEEVVEEVGEEEVEDQEVADDEGATQEAEEVEDVLEDEEDEPEGTDEVEDEGEEDQEPSDEVGEEEEDVEEVEGAELDDFRKQMNLIAQAALKQGVQLPPDILGIEEGEPEPQPEVVPPTPAQTPAALPIAPQSGDYSTFDILTEGVDFNDFLEDETKFVGGMRDILYRHEQMMAQSFMRVLPGIIQQQANQIMTLQNAANKFYQVNNDLEPVRATVGAVANQIAAKNPQWELEKVLSESAKTTRKLLKMPSPGKGKKAVKPSFAKSKSPARKMTKVKKSKLQKEIDDILI